MAAFSYAQAAKGTTPANPVEAKTTDAIIDSNGLKIDAPNESASNSVQPNIAASVSGSTSSSANDGATCSSESVRDEEEQNADISARRSSEAGSRSGGNRRQESKKTRPEKKNKDTVTTEAEPKPEPVKVELTEAPPPPVNIWQQRMKAKPATAETAKLAAATEQSSTKSKSTKNSETEAEGSSRKSRAPRSADKEAKNAEHIIVDSNNWPTPETAMKEKVVLEKPSPKVAEKPIELVAEKEDETSKGKQASKKVWEKVEFTPTARFETQIPGHRGPRAARSTPRPPRENSSRAHSGSAKDSEKVSPAAPHHGKGEHKERSRDNNAPRTASQPPKKGNDHVSKEPCKSATSSSAQSAPQSVPKDASAPATESVPHRSDTRSDRPPRGNGRSRGGYHNNNGPAPINTQQSYAGFNPNSASRQNIVSPSRQPYSGNYSQGRGHRGGRNHSISMRNGGSNRMSGQNNYSHDYSLHGMAPNYPMMNYVDPSQTMWAIQSVISQISYYFSIDNLCKDIFLRKHMDSQGFVPLQLISQFKRVSDITATIDADPLDTIREACAHLALPAPDGTAFLEFVIGDDNVERLRLAQGWDKWVIEISDRVEGQRNAGPAAYNAHPQISNAYMHHYGPMYPLMSPPTMAPAYQGYPQPGYRGGFNGGYPYPMNAGNNVYAPSFHASVSTPLSANVPSFSPSAMSFPTKEAAVASTAEAVETPATTEGQN